MATSRASTIPIPDMRASLLSHFRAPASTSRKSRRVCKTEFDYDAWKAWGDWRRDEEARLTDPQAWKRHTAREVARRSPSFRQRKVWQRQETEYGAAEQAARMARFAARTHDCSKDCDYPSQCHHERAKWSMSRMATFKSEETRTGRAAERAAELGGCIELRTWLDDVNEAESAVQHARDSFCGAEEMAQQKQIPDHGFTLQSCIAADEAIAPVEKTERDGLTPWSQTRQEFVHDFDDNSMEDEMEEAKRQAAIGELSELSRMGCRVVNAY
ncbi:hypothetical protein G7046_g782 [Stylonectria norvegica]|nr:hypothetical protein G7046_g782 [Stylonectria norvegica]